LEATLQLFSSSEYGKPVQWSSLSWEASSHSDGQSSSLLWNLKVHYCFHKIPQLDPIVSQISPVHIVTPYYSQIHFNSILPSVRGSSIWSLLFRIST
jgi:hypothetical protein